MIPYQNLYEGLQDRSLLFPRPKAQSAYALYNHRQACFSFNILSYMICISNSERVKGEKGQQGIKGDKGPVGSKGQKGKSRMCTLYLYLMCTMWPYILGAHQALCSCCIYNLNVAAPSALCVLSVSLQCIFTLMAYLVIL